MRAPEIKAAGGDVCQSGLPFAKKYLPPGRSSVLLYDADLKEDTSDQGENK